jgi:UDP-N-acetylglucosamine 4-epimerase
MERAYTRLERELRARPRVWLVTGAAGFIGSHLVERLLLLDQRVHGLDDFSTGRRANLAAVERAVGPERCRRLSFVEGDVCERATVRAACEGCELVLHQAGLGSVVRSLAEPERCLEVNAAGTWTVLAAARAAGARRFVLASSSSVYGDRLDTPQQEERIGRALSPYAASKQAAELVAAGFSRGLAFPSVALRYFNVFGPRQDPHGPYAAVIARWSAALVAGQAPVLEGDGRQTRDFTPVAVVVEANLLAACRPLPEPALALNVGTGRETSLNELLALLRRIAAELGLERGGFLPLGVAARPGDRRASCADVTRARAWLGYEPALGLEDGLRATLEELVDSRARAS